ncbi:MAG: hypothetical protein Q9187_007647, partial [Circinaria calcarea]
MSDPQVRIHIAEASIENLSGDVEMAGRDEVEIVEVLETDPGEGPEAEGEEEGEEEEAEEEEDEKVFRVTFIEHSARAKNKLSSERTKPSLSGLRSSSDESHHFRRIRQYEPPPPGPLYLTRRIELLHENLDAVGSFLQYLYTGEYFPRFLGEGRDAGLESDPDVPETDESGEQLLKHARVYTLADKLGIAELKALAHSKVHRVNSTAKSEIAYARFVYANTPRTDTVIRKPIANFWGMRAYVLRHEAEDDFKALCLEFPEFGFDVLSYVLDAREKKG